MKLLLFFVVFICLGFYANSQDWPDWRGADRDGTWNETGIVEKFDSDVIKQKWSVPIGSGYSGPTVSNGKVYVTDLIEKPVQTEGVLCCLLYTSDAADDLLCVD